MEKEIINSNQNTPKSSFLSSTNIGDYVITNHHNIFRRQTYNI